MTRTKTAILQIFMNTKLPTQGMTYTLRDFKQNIIYTSINGLHTGKDNDENS
jgi:hypothetical protein